MSEENEIFDLATIDPKKLPELQGWKEKQLQAVKENPFVEITDNESYQIAKKHRTALVTCRTTLQNQDKEIASKIKEFRANVGRATQELIDITLPHENKQQEEVKRYEAEKEAEKQRKAEEERQRVQEIKDQMENFKAQIGKIRIQMVFPSIENSINEAEKLAKEYNENFDFQEFEPMFEELCKDAMASLNEKVSELQEKEEQRLENERLAKEAEENAKKAKLQSERMTLIKEHIGHGPDFEISDLAEMPEEEFNELLSKKRFAHAKAKEEAEKKEAEEARKQEEQAARDKKLQEEEERVAQEKEQLRLAKEAENKMAQRSKRLTDELGLKFNFVDAFVGQNTEYVPVIDIKTKTDEEFDTIVENIKNFQQNGEEKNPFENQNSEDFEGVEDVDFEEPVSEFEKAIDENIKANSMENGTGLNFEPHLEEISPIDKPIMLDESKFDLTDLKDTCQGYIDFVWSDDFHEDNDYKQYIFETAMIALFGKDVFNPINKKLV